MTKIYSVLSINKESPRWSTIMGHHYSVDDAVNQVQTELERIYEDKLIDQLGSNTKDKLHEYLELDTGDMMFAIETMDIELPKPKQEDVWW